MKYEVWAETDEAEISIEVKLRDGLEEEQIKKLLHKMIVNTVKKFDDTLDADQLEWGYKKSEK